MSLAWSASVRAVRSTVCALPRTPNVDCAQGDVFGLEWRAQPHQGRRAQAVEAAPRGEPERIAERHGVSREEVEAAASRRAA